MKVKGIAKLLSAVMAITCISFPAVSHAEDTTETTAVKTKLIENFWGNDSFAAVNYAAGYLENEYGDYAASSVFSFNTEDASDRTIVMNDNTLEDSQLVSNAYGGDKKVNPNDTSLRGFIEKATGWGFAGYAVRNTAGSDASHNAGVYDMRSYADNGSIVFKIDATDQDITGAYLTLGFYQNLYNLGFYDDYYTSQGFDIIGATSLDGAEDALDAGDTAYNEAKGTTRDWRKGPGSGNDRYVNYVGVPLSKYYDSTAGGSQVLAVPLSDFANNAEFNKVGGKGAEKLVSEDRTATFNPALIKSAGVARVDQQSGKTFQIKLNDIRLVAPKKVTNFVADKTANSVQLVWEPTTDTDVTYKVLKTVKGTTTEIVPEEEGEYLDTDVDLTEDGPEIRYAIAAVDTRYGAVTKSDEIVINEKVETTAVAKNLFSRFWGGSTSANGMGNFSYASGYSNQWGDYDAGKTSSYNPDTAAYIINLNDNTLTGDQLITFDDKADDFARGKTVNARQDSSNGFIEKATGWGYAGFKVEYNSTLDINRGAILDLTDYMDNGSIAFVVNADGQDVSEAYLTIGFFKNLYDMGFNGNGSYAYQTAFNETAIKALETDKVSWYGGKGQLDYFHMNLSGVPLSKYYDSTKGGDQVVTVPLSEFVNNVEFRRMAGKNDQKLSTAEHTETFNPALIKTVGIARTDSGAGKAFSIQVKDAKLVAPKTPRSFAAVKVSNGVQLTWKNTTDTDVTYKIVKTVDGNTTYIDAQSGYIDTDVDLDNTDVEVRYAIAAVDTKYGATVKTDEIIFNEQVTTNPFKERLISPYWGDDNSVTFNYGVGLSNEYGDYRDAIKDATNKAFTVVLNDNTLSDSDLLTSTDFAKGKKINPRDKSKSFGLIEKATGWGYAGISIRNSAGTNTAHNGAVIDARDYADGSISFTLDATGQNLDGAYLTLGYYKSLYEGEFWQDTWQPIHNKTALDADVVSTLDNISANWVKGDGNYKTLRLVGVPLSKYYDSSKGGDQTITIPFSEFIKNATFNKAAGKIDNGGTQLSSADWDNSLNLALLKSAGIARMDSKSNATFTATLKDISIVAPKAVKTFTAEKSGDGVQLNWKETTDENVKYEVVKKVNRQEEIITPTESGKYFDKDVNLDDKTTEVRYAIRVTDTVYGAQVTTNDIVFNEIENTTGVKETVYASSKTADMAGFGYAVGYASQYGDYEKIGATEANGEVSIVLNDNNFTDDQLYKRGDKEFAAGTLTNPKDDISTGVIEKATGWGYSGRRLIYSEANDTHPAGVMDARAYADNAQVIFNVDATGQNLDGAYLTIGTFSNLANLAFSDSKYGTLPLETNLDKADELTAINAEWKKTNSTLNYGELDFYGVPLSKYYDSAKGGYQTIIVPLSEFAENSSFNKFAVKQGSGQLSTVDHKNTLNPALIRTLGIARTDSKSNASFTAKIKNIAIAAPAEVTKLTAQASAENVKLTWLISTDTDISGYEIFRNGEKIATTTDTAYVDNTDLASGEYTYEVRTVSSAFEGLYSAKVSAKATVPVKNSIKFTDGDGAELKYVKAGTVKVALMSVTADTQGYAAVFDNDGALKSVKKAALGAEEKTITFDNVLATDKVKAFIWNKDMVPVTAVKAIGEKTTNVLVIGDELSAQASDYVDEIANGAGKSITVTNAYIAGGRMADHYKAVTEGSKVYTKAVNGTVSGGTFTLSDILNSASWDYVILQDKSVYAGMDEYYAKDAGDYMTQLLVIKKAITDAAPDAALFAGEGWGYTPDYLNNENASDADKAFYKQMGTFMDTTSDPAAMTVYYINAALGGAQINVGDAMMEYTEDGSAVIGSTGCDLNETGKFFASAMIYHILTNTAVTDAFVPSGVTDSANILTLVNGK